VAALRVVAEGNPDWPFGHGLLAAALWLLGEEGAARARFAEFVSRVPDAAARRPARLIQVPPGSVSADYHRHDAPTRQAFAALEDAAG
jgi:hypothetical protein